ncbi:MAG: HAD hydrolase family protein, partial [Kiritimatiellae bacterium]|nr:HAD hydrolase family protein [Kiritimatiellia bacterium]
ITGVDDAPEGLIHQVSIHNETLEEAAETAAWVNANFGDSVTAFQNVIEVDIAPKGCSKGEGVKRLREWMREQWGDVTLYGIGDSNNDLPLLEEADVSYTFPYAPPELQGRADKVVPTIVDALRDSMEHNR